MKGNFHVRFLEGGGLATARSHSVRQARVNLKMFKNTRNNAITTSYAETIYHFHHLK